MRRMNRRHRDASFHLALANLPAPLLQLGFDFAASAMMQRRPAVAERLRCCAGARILIEPRDVNRALVLAIEEGTGRVRLDVASGGERARATARIAGPLPQLLDLLEGSVDGDALFFARDLAFSGDTAAIVALRNALDGEEIDLVEDLLGALGPLAAPARLALAAAGGFAAALTRPGRLVA
jgi:O2-independent ubiquinone biosynthesis accessory factor UbiT